MRTRKKTTSSTSAEVEDVEEVEVEALPKTGWYKHFEGGLYALRVVVRHHDTDERWALYVPAAGAHRGDPPIRPLGEWTAEVEWPDGETRPRFVHLDEAPDV